MTTTTKQCTLCKEVLPLSSFHMRSNRKDGPKFPSTRCRPCIWQARKEKRKGRVRTEREKELVRLRNARDKIHREEGKNTGYFVLHDCRGSDRKKGRECDLDRAFVDSLVSQPCSYCGDTETRMTLDRKNNALGHLKSNVVAACIRCNLLRGDMPLEAWNNIVPAVKATKEKGLFGLWGTKPTRKR